LYVSAGRHYECVEQDGDVLDAVPAAAGPHGVVVVASEPLTRHAEDWMLIPANHTLTIDPERRVALQPITLD
jgi:predicted glutamine amidotransferase